MALEPRDDDPLARAVAQAKADPVALPEQTWAELSRSIMSRVRTVVLPGEPLLTFGPDGDPARDEQGSRTYVSSRLVLDALRRLLSSRPSHAPDDIRLRVTDGRLDGVDVELVATYGQDLRALADDVRREVLAAVRDLLGTDPGLGLGQVDIEFTDLVDGPPQA